VSTDDLKTADTKVQTIPLFHKSKPFDPSVLEKELPRPLWVKIAFGGAFLFFLGLFFYALSEPLSYPKNVSVSNVSSQSITMSWTTQFPDETKVVLTEADLSQYLPVFFYSALDDDRDQKDSFRPKRNVHYVSLKGFKAQHPLYCQNLFRHKKHSYSKINHRPELDFA
jgi:hypothetical protein